MWFACHPPPQIATGNRCAYQPLEEGYRSLGGRYRLPILTGLERDAAYEYINLVSGPAGSARLFDAAGPIFRLCPETPRTSCPKTEWAIGSKANGCHRFITSPTVNALGAGWRCAGPAVTFNDRMGSVALLELRHGRKPNMSRKWNEFIAA